MASGAALVSSAMLAAQAVTGDVAFHHGAQLRGEVGVEPACQMRLVEERALQQRVRERDLGIGEQRGQFRPGEAVACACPLHQLGIRGQGFKLAGEQARLLEVAHQQ
jgi:hypothetical protein